MQLISETKTFQPVILKIETLEELLALTGAVAKVSGSTASASVSQHFSDVEVSPRAASDALYATWQLLKDESAKYGKLR